MAQPRNIDELFDNLNELIPTPMEKSGFIVGLRLAKTRPDLIQAVLDKITSMSGAAPNQIIKDEEDTGVLFAEVRL